MKNVMRAISLGLVCAIATSNVAHANQTDEKSPTKWEMTKNIGCAIGALPVFLVSCALLRAPRSLVIAKTIKATLEHAKDFDAPRLIRTNRVVAQETKSWRWRQALAGLGFVTSFAIAKESYDRHDAQETEKILQKYRMEQLKDDARHLQAQAAREKRLFDRYSDRLHECLKTKESFNHAAAQENEKKLQARIAQLEDDARRFQEEAAEQKRRTAECTKQWNACIKTKYITAR